MIHVIYSYVSPSCSYWLQFIVAVCSSSLLQLCVFYSVLSHSANYESILECKSTLFNFSVYTILLFIMGIVDSNNLCIWASERDYCFSRKLSRDFSCNKLFSMHLIVSSWLVYVSEHDDYSIILFRLFYNNRKLIYIANHKSTFNNYE